jgi:hypothetical protein
VFGATILFREIEQRRFSIQSLAGDVFFARWPASMSDLKRMSLAEFSKLYLRSRLLSSDEPKRDPPAPPTDEDKYAAQVVLAVMKSRN